MTPRKEFHELALFAGAGGSLLAGRLLGWHPVCAVELDPYCRRVLLARQRDGLLPRFPIWDDVRTFEGGPWRGHVDVITGGFPCQDISNAGKRQGISGSRSGLWAEFARIIGEVRPRYAFIENTAALAHRGLDRVLADLAALGLDARWCCLGADDVGAPHIRKRLWILAYHHDRQCEQSDKQVCTGGNATQPCRDAVADAACVRMENQPISAQGNISVGDAGWCDSGHPDFQGLEVGQGQRHHSYQEQQTSQRAGWWSTEPGLDRVVNGVADSMDIT